MKHVDLTRRGLLFSSAAFALAGCRSSAAADDRWTDGLPLAHEGGIRVRFLGSGAAGRDPAKLKKNPHLRRQSSVLIENRVLIDFTPCSFDLLPKGVRPETMFQTHSHGDHYNPAAAVKSGVKRMYVHESWAKAAQREVAGAAAKLQLPAPDVIALPFGRPVQACGLTVTAVPAIHSTSRATDGVLERTALYLVEKGPSRLLYATDTAGLPCDAARMVGVDPQVTADKHSKFYAGNPMVRTPQPITALVMEATCGDQDESFMLFAHSSVQTVVRTVNMLRATGRYVPPAGQHAYLTHLGVKYRGWSAERVDKELPDSLRAAFDGLEVVLG